MRQATADESIVQLTAQARADMADFAKELGHPQLAEARDAGQLDTRLIRKFDINRTTRETPEGGAELVSERVKLELYDAQRATEILIKAKGGLEESIRREYERGIDDLFTTIIAEFSREGDEAVLDRLEQVLDDYRARHRHT